MASVVTHSAKDVHLVEFKKIRRSLACFYCDEHLVQSATVC